MAGLLIFDFLLVFLLARGIAVEVRKTSFSVLEGLIAVNVIGIAASQIFFLVYRENPPLRRSHGDAAILFFSILTAITLALAPGGFWALRRLKLIDERRGPVRIVYLIFGMALVPSLLVIVPLLIISALEGSFYAGLLGSIGIALMWRAMFRLEKKAEPYRRD